jgi:hypothetical protein
MLGSLDPVTDDYGKQLPPCEHKDCRRCDVHYNALNEIVGILKTKIKDLETQVNFLRGNQVHNTAYTPASGNYKRTTLDD